MAILLTTALVQSLLTGNTTTAILIAIALTASAFSILITLIDATRRSALERWTSRLAAGQLDQQLDQGGRDGTAIITQAVEILRLNSVHSQEVQSLSEELQDRNQELENTLEELRLTQDQTVSQQKLTELGEITKAVAHELRNPLQFIQNFSEGSSDLLEQLTTIIPADGSPMNQEQLDLFAEVQRELRESLRYITIHGKRASQAVTQMQGIGRGIHENFEERELNSIVRQCARTTCEQLEQQGCQLENKPVQIDLDENFDPHMGEVRMIPSDFGQAIMNITENAVHAVQERCAREKQHQPSILLETRKRGVNAEIRIWDNGPGMKPEIIERAFTPFFTTKLADQGAGLGLTIAKDIIREHRGTIVAESEPGEYTVITVSIPMGEEREAEFAREWEI